MKTALAGVASLPDGVICELYEIRLKSGTILRYTTGQSDVVWGGHTFLADVITMERGTIISSIADAGLPVQECEVTLYPKDIEVFIGGESLAQFINRGAFDNAVVVIYRARFAYVVHLFEGFISNASSDRVSSTIKISDPKMMLDVEMPRLIWQPGCRHTLFGPGCLLSKTAFEHSSSVASGSTLSVIQCGLTQANDFFDLGEIVFTSGNNDGFSRSVKNYTVGVVYLSNPLPFIPEIGDTFKIVPGCDGRLVTCNDVFNNKINFGGQPFFPTPEQSV